MVDEFIRLFCKPFTVVLLFLLLLLFSVYIPGFVAMVSRGGFWVVAWLVVCWTVAWFVWVFVVSVSKN